MHLKFILMILIFTIFIGCTNLSRIDRVESRIISEFVHEMVKEGLSVYGRGGGEKDSKINLIDVCFKVDQVLNIENARKLIVKSGESLILIIKKENTHESIFLEKDPLNSILLSIIGRSTNLSEEHVISVSLCKGKVFYSAKNFENPKGLWIDIHEETFEEAQNIVHAQEREQLSMSITLL